eukprot:2499513-Amphidinium_carterae.2
MLKNHKGHGVGYAIDRWLAVVLACGMQALKVELLECLLAELLLAGYVFAPSLGAFPVSGETEETFYKQLCGDGALCEMWPVTAGLPQMGTVAVVIHA